MIILISNELLFMHAVRHQTVLASDIASLYGIDLKCQSGAAAGIIMDLGVHLFGNKVFQHQMLHREHGAVLPAFHKDPGAGFQLRISLLRSLYSDTQLFQIGPVHNDR